MAKIRIGDLGATSSLASIDVLPVVSISQDTTYKISVKDLSDSLTEVSSSISASHALYAISASYSDSASIADYALNSGLLEGRDSATFINTGSYGSTQVISGSLVIQQNITIQGTSSIEHVTASQLDISTNLITVNTENPSFRFGGLAVIDSGSSPQTSGSILYDSVQDEWIFVHRGASSTVTSSHFLVGPETYGDIGNEIYVPQNRLIKSTGNEHVTGSNIFDNGTNVQITGSNILVTGDLGVGSSSPSAKLHVSASSGVSLQIETNNSNEIQFSGNTNANIYQSVASADMYYSCNGGTLYFGSSTSATHLNISNGNVGIATTSPTYKLEVSGSSRITGSLAIGNITPSATLGRIDASNDIVAFSTSDSNYKVNVKTIGNALEKVKSLSGVEFDWIENPEIHGNSGHDVGVIAQEVEKVLPEVVTTRENGVKAVKYEKIVPLLIEAVKDLQKQVEDLKRSIK